MLGWSRKNADSASSDPAEADSAWRETETGLCKPDDDMLSGWTPSVPLPLPGPDEEQARRASESRLLAALRARGDGVYQYVVNTLARVCDTPLAGISLLKDGVFELKSLVGMVPAKLPAQGTPCGQVVQGSSSVIVARNMASDPRFAGARQWQLDGRPVVFYAGARLMSARGEVLGVAWVADFAERDLSPVQLRALELLARHTALLMEPGQTQP